ncbi:hypothetical protein ESA_04303 [Cronobacter sakazakii ATCC BAA-894]|uniref:Uncharacterized protein n=1 Tax=Cronobacter sakazakii (strain ATCC BAA-894) TaxID=290339 RepID=A7ME87_CROS8|nr:hypothetical protein ESA_04303 [Cronobacter sakazakii ATCC BAA-894]
MRLEEVPFARAQAAFDHFKIAFQPDEREVRVAAAQNIAIAFFQRRADDERHFVGALHGESGVVKRLQPWRTVVIVKRIARRHFHNIAARMQKVAIEKRGFQTMRDFAGDNGFPAAGNAHQDINMVIMIGRAHCSTPLAKALRIMLRVTVNGNIVWLTLKISNFRRCSA